MYLNLYDYFLNFSSKTIKRYRTYLIKEFHKLNDSIYLLGLLSNLDRISGLEP